MDIHQKRHRQRCKRKSKRKKQLKDTGEKRGKNIPHPRQQRSKESRVGSSRAAGKKIKKQNSKAPQTKSKELGYMGDYIRKEGRTMARYFIATAEIARGVGISPSFPTDTPQNIIYFFK